MVIQSSWILNSKLWTLKKQTKFFFKFDHTRRTLRKIIFTFKKVYKARARKISTVTIRLLNDTIHKDILKKNGPNNRLMKKRKKNQIICSKKFKGGTRRKPIGFAIKPRLIQAKHRQQYTIVIIRCYHQSMLLWVF